MTAGTGDGAGKGPAADPTMEDILASIRRILNEDEAPPAPAGEAPAPAPEADGPLILTEEMMVQPAEEPKASEPMSAADIAALFDDPPPAPAPAPPPPEPVAQAEPEPPPVMAAPVPPPPVAPAPLPVAMPEPAMAPMRDDAQDALIGATAAAAASAAVAQLMRTVAAERAAPVYRGGPSIEDVVREELRPLLKDWLDNHLPPLVERLVRAEIERVVGRAVG